MPLPDVVTAFLEHRAGAPRAAARRAARAGCETRLAKRRRPDVWDDVDAARRISRSTSRVVDAAGGELAAGRDLAALRAQLGEAAQLSFAARGPGVRAQAGSRHWDFGDLPETLDDRARRRSG